MNRAFLALRGAEDGYLTAHDLVQAAADVHVYVSPELAQHMIAAAKGTTANHQSHQRLTRQEFVNFFGPPDP